MYELWPHQTVKSGYPYVYYKPHRISTRPTTFLIMCMTTC